MVINCEDIEIAKKTAKDSGAWEGFDVVELDTTSKGIVFTEAS